MKRPKGLRHSVPLFMTLLGLTVSGRSATTNPTTTSAVLGQRPNILLILIDDHGANMTSVLNESPARTPNMERLAARGSWFQKAYSGAPSCAPSRASFLTGIHPSRSGVYYNSQAYRRTTAAISRADTLQRHFLNHGYLTVGYGKINHTAYQDDNIADFRNFRGHSVGKYVTYNDVALVRYVIPETLRKFSRPDHASTVFGALPDDWDRDDPKKLQQDTEQANRAIEFLNERHDGPFFLTCGFWRPHVNNIVPKRYYDLYPLESIKMPASYRADDLDDVANPHRWVVSRLTEDGADMTDALRREFLRSFYAATSYVDEQLGRVLDALEQSFYAKNTIIVFMSDNGSNHGDKSLWTKYALWEQTCRVVFSISVPGLPQQFCPSPVSLLDLYPTLLSLSGLPPPTTHELDGVDLTLILKGERVERGKPVLTTHGQGNHSIRDRRFRYIRFRNGEEELYDHDNDRFEWTNLAAEPRYAEVKAKLARLLPTVDAPDIERARPPESVELPAEVFKQWPVHPSAPR